MKFYGDIPIEHLNAIEELQSLEDWFNKHGSELPSLSVAKGFVAMSLDYFTMEIEEEGERLLRIAEKQCPGYFMGPIYVHIEKDKDFSKAVMLLRQSLAIDTMKELGFL